MAAIVDKYFHKLVSRKLLVWVTATALTVLGFIDGSSWVTLSVVYLSGQSLIDYKALTDPVRASKS